MANTAQAVKLAQLGYIAMKARLDQANADSAAMWGEFSEDEIDGWSDEQFTTVANQIESFAGTIPTGDDERIAARALVRACQAHVKASAKTSRDYRARAAMLDRLFERWETLLSIRERMIAECLKLDPEA